MKTSIKIFALALFVSMSMSCGTTLKTTDGSKFTTYANGKKMDLTMPNGTKLTMKEFDHATSIMAAGSAVNEGLKQPATMFGAWMLGKVAINQQDTSLGKTVAGHRATTSVANTASNNAVKIEDIKTKVPLAEISAE